MIMLQDDSKFGDYLLQNRFTHSSASSQNFQVSRRKASLCLFQGHVTQVQVPFYPGDIVSCSSWNACYSISHYSRRQMDTATVMGMWCTVECVWFAD